MKLRLFLVCIAALVAGPSGRALHASAMAGLWATEGYGLMLDIGPDGLKGYEVTSVSCLQTFTAKSAAAPSAALAAFTLADEPVTFLVLPEASPNRARIHVAFAASDMIIRSIDRRPAACEKPLADTPRTNFDVFAATWAEHYPFFADKHVDWAAVVAANRPKVTDATTPEELFAILAGMISPLQDAHTSLVARAINKTYQGVRRTPSFLPGAARDQGYRLVDAHLTGPLQKFCEGRVEFGMLASDVGYLRIRSFSGYTKDGAFETGLAALEAALDTAFAAASTWKGLVVDVRLNGGGADPYGLAIAGRLTDAAYTAYVKQARSDPADASRWTPEQPSVVQPGRRPRFVGPVVELIGIQSVSAAETFTQALLKRPVRVTRVGENTQGVFSDVLDRRLPNGWKFGLPNERFVTDGKSYDGPGIAPDVPVESFTPAARATGRDAAIEKALEILKR
jgi:Peptidase family S41/Tricorn protease C1 domain